MPKEEDFEIEAEKKLSMDGSTVEEEEEFPTCSSLPDGETEEEML